MTSKLTREWLQDRIANMECYGVVGDEALILQAYRMALAAMDSEPNRNPVLAYADSYRDMEKQGVESVPIWSVITDLERNIAPLYRHAQQPVVPDFETVLESLDYDVRCNIRESEHVYQASKATYDACRAAMLAAAPQEVNHG